MIATYSIAEIKDMIPLLDEEGIEILSDLLLTEKQTFRQRDLKAIFKLMQERIDFLKDGLNSWPTDFLYN